MSLLQVNIPILKRLTDISKTNDMTLVTDTGSYVTSIVLVILTIGALATFIYLVWGGISWLTAGSDKGKVEEARSRIVNAIIGLAIIASSYAIYGIIDNFLGINIATSVSSATSAGGGGSVCSCSNGGCASVSQIGALTLNGDCYRCTTTGWVATGQTGCGAISCGACQ